MTIRERLVERPCPLCGALRKVREFFDYPRLTASALPEGERSAQTPSDWKPEPNLANGERKY